MAKQQSTCPMSRQQVLDAYFLEHRAKLIDIAAFLDRLDRAESTDSESQDFRIAAMREAVAVLLDENAHRAKRILEIFSDPTESMIESAQGMKGAVGASDTRSEGGGS